MQQVDQRAVIAVDDVLDDEPLPDQRARTLEYILAVLIKNNLTDLDRAVLVAVDGSSNNLPFFFRRSMSPRAK